MSFKVSIAEQLHYARAEMERRRALTASSHAESELVSLRKSLSERVMVEDERILDDLIAVGFNAENVGVLPLVPLICVAWADGEVQAGEAKRILDLAKTRGLDQTGAAYQLLEKLLREEPDGAYLSSCLYVLREFYDSLGIDESKRAKQNLLGFSYVVAKAAGGVLGIFGNKVSDEEKTMIEEIADVLGVSRSRNSASVHGIVAVKAEDSEEEPAPSE